MEVPAPPAFSPLAQGPKAKMRDGLITRPEQRFPQLRSTGPSYLCLSSPPTRLIATSLFGMKTREIFLPLHDMWAP